MKKVSLMLMIILIFLSGNQLKAQTTATKLVAAEEITPAKLLKWTNEVLPKMERLVPKLEKIKAGNTGKATSDALRLLAQVNHLKEIKAKGARLKPAEARKYYDLISPVVNSFYIECQSQNNNICCVDCQNHGILGIWCFANCFVARFPDQN